MGRGWAGLVTGEAPLQAVDNGSLASSSAWSCQGVEVPRALQTSLPPHLSSSFLSCLYHAPWEPLPRTAARPPPSHPASPLPLTDTSQEHGAPDLELSASGSLAGEAQTPDFLAVLQGWGRGGV